MLSCVLSAEKFVLHKQRVCASKHVRDDFDALQVKERLTLAANDIACVFVQWARHCFRKKDILIGCFLLPESTANSCSPIRTRTKLRLAESESEEPLLLLSSSLCIIHLCQWSVKRLMEQKSQLQCLVCVLRSVCRSVAAKGVIKNEVDAQRRCSRKL